MSEGPLAGRSVLVVEDRYLIASEMADAIRDMGARVVGPSRNVAGAQDMVDREPVDSALLDVNLDGELVFPLAEALTERGVPFIFLTGYDEDILPPPWRDRPRLAKPVDRRALCEALVKLAKPLG
jgi:response regulator RpfG family c-di-GMP phosphodiesterase